eukprot:scaffold34638_cov161-Amphora_coffeaeformis.AAC.19
MQRRRVLLGVPNQWWGWPIDPTLTKMQPPCSRTRWTKLPKYPQKLGYLLYYNRGAPFRKGVKQGSHSFGQPPRYRVAEIKSVTAFL